MTDDNVSLVYSYSVSSSSEIDSMSSLSTHPTSALSGNDTGNASCSYYNDPDSAVVTSYKVYLGMSSVFVVVGLIGNVLSVLVFTSRDMRAVSSNVYLFVLAISDSLYLIGEFIGNLLPMARCLFFPWAPVDIMNRSEFMCDAIYYFIDLFGDYSTCIIMAFTFERALAVFSPITFRNRCTVARARIVCAVMFVVIAALILPYHVMMMKISPDNHECNVDYENTEVYFAFYLVEVVAFCVVPVTTIAILNAFIIARRTRLNGEKNRRRRYLAAASAGNKPSDCAKNSVTGATNGESQHLTVLVCTDGDKPSVRELDVIDKHSNSLSLPRLNVNGGTGNHNEDNAMRHFFPQPTSTPASQVAATSASSMRCGSLDDRNRQLTIILILVSLTYILAFLPSMIIYFVGYAVKLKWINDGNRELKIIECYTSALFIGGFAINFFLYTMSGRVFRDQLRSILCPSHNSATSAAADGLQCMLLERSRCRHVGSRTQEPSHVVGECLFRVDDDITEFVNEPAATTAF